MATSTGVGQLQFVRPCRHGAERAGAAHADDHIDVFLDTFRMDHDIALKRRLELEPVSLSLADLLLTKLQIFRLNDKDIRDIVTLLDDAEVSDGDEPGTIDARYIGGSVRRRLGTLLRRRQEPAARRRTRRHAWA